MTVSRTSYSIPGMPAYPTYADKLEEDRQDTLEKIASRASLGLFSVSVASAGNKPASVTDKAIDSTTRQYKRTLLADLGEKGINAALTKLKPSDATLATSGVGMATTPPNADYAKTLFDKLNTRLRELDDIAQTQNGRSSVLYKAFGQETWGGSNGIKANFDAFGPCALFGIGRNLAGNTVTLADGSTKILSWNEAVAKNFEKFNGRLYAPTNGTPLTVGNYLKYGVTGNWARGLGKFLATGQGFMGAVVSSLQIGFLFVSTGLTMKKQWEKSTEKNEGFLTKLFKTAFAGAKEFTKIVLGYQLGELAFCLTYGLIATPYIGAAVGLAAACTTGVLTGLAWNKLFGKSVEEDPPAETADPRLVAARGPGGGMVAAA